MSVINCLIVMGAVIAGKTQNICIPEHFSLSQSKKLYISQNQNSSPSNSPPPPKVNPISPQTPQSLPRNLPTNKPHPLQPNSPERDRVDPTPSIPGTIVVERFEFLDATAFTTEELNQATQNLLNRPISFAELLQVETIITRLYVEAGYINSGAYVASGQKLDADSAVVEIQVIEGGLESVEITGTSQLNANYIRDRIPAAREIPLDRQKLLEDLQLLQLNPLIESISAKLAAGTRPEASSLTIDIKEADTFSLEAFIDNGRNPSVGSFRRGLRLEENNFLGFGDRLTIGYTNTDGSNAGDFSYSFPLNHQNGSIDLAAGINDTEVVESPFDELDIVGDSYYLDLSLRQPIVFKPTQEFALGVSLSYQNSQTELLGDDFSFSSGSGDGETSISAIRFFQEYTQRNPTDLLALRSQLSIGLDLFDSTTENDSADSRFVAWRGQTQYVKLLAADTLLILRGDIQITDDELLSQERFSLGGFNTVRGYRQDLLLSDGGILASTEVQLPILRFAGNEGILHLIPFIDFGTAWNVDSTSELDPDTLVSVGVGLRLNFNNVLNVRIDWGIPLIDDNNDDPDTLQENGIHFSLDYRL